MIEPQLCRKAYEQFVRLCVDPSKRAEYLRENSEQYAVFAMGYGDGWIDNSVAARKRRAV